MNITIYLTGLTMGLSLIAAIGAQNAFVLRQGLRREHVAAVCLSCALSDALLITLGVSSFGRIIEIMPWLDPLMRAGGAAFLLWYGARSLKSALASTDMLLVGAGMSVPLSRSLMTCLALTWLNPHVYLDTVVLLGTISTQFPGHETSFALGAITGSFLFFFALGYGAAWLRPLFARPQAWRILEAVIALVMFSIAARLVFGN
ncbi:LysE/ArgO family amino acid transporter [Rhizobium sp. SSA_523]|uniref:LysE/ArgO family amino acid transporter n=1 Tax=Rhizobium sp. SSA_523 TaxID=2952477 RepID=UPI002091E13E|nr:LysE/ArgO family amino acid transporter [Rhizobium sp. SSA_523]MCO5730462.1 LysE/ArgO family amino acid transporter [Rhizobium sp. SSA_523]WKC25503.1 LysE/ArgO family amino acid transporter [Rhizobium sp. SSA_523]